jgi:hypothetical protein
MTLDEANKIIRDRTGSMHEMAAATTFVMSYYNNEGKHLLRPAKFAKFPTHMTYDRGRGTYVSDDPVTTREGAGLVKQDYRESFNASSRTHSEMGAAPDPRAVGGKLIAEFDGPASALILIAHGNGKVGLYRVGNAIGALNPGRAVTGTGKFTADAQRFAKIAQARVADEQERNKEWAKGVGDFWKKQAAHG